MVETRLIAYFLAIAREQSITKAASALHVTQPTLSKQMMELEKQLGCRLFVRGKKQITLTDEGQFFRRRGQEMLELMASTEASLRSSEQFITGEINLGCGETAHMEYIAAMFARLHALYPDIRLNLYSANTEAVLERMDQGLVDIGLLLNPPGSEKYEALDIGCEDRFGLLMPRDHPDARREFVTMEDLKRIPLIVSTQTFSRYERSSFPLNESEIHIVSTYNLLYNAAFLVAQGIGCALTLERLAHTDGSHLVFRPLEPPVRAPWKLVLKKYQPQPPAVKAFMNLFRDP